MAEWKKTEELEQHSPFKRLRERLEELKDVLEDKKTELEKEIERDG